MAQQQSHNNQQLGIQSGVSHGARSVEISPELAERLIAGEITLAQFTGLPQTTLYEIADEGFKLFNSGRLSEAKQIYQGLVAASPFDSVFHCHLAAVHHRLGEFDRAFDEYTEAIRFNIENVDALAGRGEIYLQRGRLAEALADLTQVIGLDPQARRATTVRARAILLALREAATHSGAMRDTVHNAKS